MAGRIGWLCMRRARPASCGKTAADRSLISRIVGVKSRKTGPVVTIKLVIFALYRLSAVKVEYLVMRFLVGLASIVLGVAVAAGYIYRDNSGATQTDASALAPLTTASTEQTAQTQTFAPKILAPKVVGEIASAQPTVLNADRSHFDSVTTAPAPTPVVQGDKARERRILVMALQGELRRVRCYEGAVNGSWNTTSKAAMFWFLKRMNAKMPVNQPDHAQLSLLKSAAKDFCAEKEAPSDFVTKVVRENNVAAGIPNPTTTIQDTTYSEARQRAGLPSNVQGLRDGSTTSAPDTADVALPAPMTVGAVSTKKKRRRYRARNRRVENLFKHPLGRY